MKKEFFFSTKALIINDNKFLAIYKLIDDKKRWDLPGGRMEFGETAEETLAREIREELEIEVKPIKLIDTWEYKPSENFHTTGIIYHCEIIPGEINISDEHDGFDWISIQDIGEIFDRDIFVDRMKSWNWDSIMNSKIVYKCYNND
ncbi:mutator protein MutT [Anaerosolibacter carboniphilus]|uniref:Mutator protein MutT n=1 Tax=Anaerosolibacter carboniphilus TaxID=1417629 RepID=A0A841L1D8_9FIRM|nr:NUDIX domain-containing protein [Anaerosolibacter carboniphilus]MBB6217990.1 mutator protein MutT [Anaerosolibacter carboniphilus]